MNENEKSNLENQEITQIINSKNETENDELPKVSESVNGQQPNNEDLYSQDHQTVKKSFFSEISPLGIALIGGGAAILVGFLALIPFFYQLIFPPLVKCGEIGKVSETIIKKLDSISQIKEVEISESKDAKYHELVDYYKETNPDLAKVLDSLDNSDGSSKDQSFKIIYIMGPAGIGKSTLVKKLKNKYGLSVCSNKLSTMFDKQPFVKELKPDLRIGEKSFNDLPSLRNINDLKFADIIRSGGCCDEKSCKPTVILDDLDEIHPELAQSILEVIENEASNLSPIPHPKNIIVMGRTEGFSYWLRERRRDPPTNLISTFIIKTPEYKSFGDLKILMEETDKTHQRQSTDNDAEDFVKLIQSHKWLTYSIGNIALANFVKESSMANSTYEDRQLMDRLFNNIVDYTKESHKRPNTADSVYLKAFEQIAARYGEQAAQKDGYFEVNFEDTIKLYDDECQFVGEVSVRNILNNSGMIFLDPVNFKTPRYRFEPFWIHSYLARRWNERISKINL